MSWLGLALVLVNLLGADFLASRVGVSPLESDMVICTAAGMVVLDQDGAPPLNTQTNRRFCLFCLPLLHAGTGMTAQTVSLPPPSPMGLFVPLLASKQAASSPSLYSSHSPRAPPVQA